MTLSMSIANFFIENSHILYYKAEKNRPKSVFIFFYFFPKKSAAAGKIATTPPTIDRIPPITQPAPICTSFVDGQLFAEANVGTTMNMNTPATTNNNTATKFNTPANFSSA